MVFTSVTFLFYFLPIVLLVYYFANPIYRNILLTIFSLIFYAWGEPIYVLLMLFSIIINYCFAIVIDTGSEYKRKIFLCLTITYNIGALLYFKYFNFFISSINDILGCNIEIDTIKLPIGISFFTFQIMSYVIDVYRRDVEVQKSIFNLSLYISLFPQLIAGPIVRYIDVEKQINDRKVDLEKFYIGVKRFAIGFSKKVLLADQLAPLVESAFTNPTSSCYLNWIGIISYTLQIYFDFSGYSDMAIGMGKMFGFDFLENFNYPYISKSIKEFWRRWHISLSTWFRDYVYIPLGGNRRGIKRQYLNLLIVFFLTGFWHGASYNFIFWGLYYGFFLIVERIGFGKKLEKWLPVGQHIYTLLVVIFGWIFFRANTLSDAIIYISNMFKIQENAYQVLVSSMNMQYWLCIFTGIVFSLPIKEVLEKGKVSQLSRGIEDVLTISIFTIAICYMVGTGFSPFLYFRF